MFENRRRHFLVLLKCILDVLGVLGIHKLNVRFKLGIFIPPIRVQILGLSLGRIKGRGHRTTHGFFVKLGLLNCLRVDFVKGRLSNSSVSIVVMMHHSLTFCTRISVASRQRTLQIFGVRSS